jgi:dihydroorotase
VTFDLVIANGRLVDPHAGLDSAYDVGIRHGRVAAVDPRIPPSAAREVIDATDHVVVPGLIDLHAHVYRAATYWGVDADAFAPSSGVTTWVDAGSAGALNFEGLREFIMGRSRVRILAFLNIAYIGLVGHDYELANLAYLDGDIFERTVRRHADVIVGAKVRMGSPTVGPHGIEPMRRALAATEACGLPLMVHMAPAGPPELSEVVELMRPGDILTHCFNGLETRLIDDRGHVLPFVERARERGVIMDIGHGAGSFSFAVAERMLDAGFTPDVISTDIHQLSAYGPLFDMPTCMTKFLALGLDLADVVKAATASPAALLGRAGEIGTLAPGAAGDVAILKLQPGSFGVADIFGESRIAREMIAVAATVAGGRLLPAKLPPSPPVWMDPVWPAHQAALTEKHVRLWEAGQDPQSAVGEVRAAFRRPDVMDDARRRLHGFSNADDGA